MEDGVVYKNVSPGQAAAFVSSIGAYGTTIVISAICIGILICHLCIMLSTKKFRQQYQTVIALSFMFTLTLISFGLEGITRILFYLRSVETMTMPVVNSRQCLQAWVFVQVFGDLTAPLLEFTMAIERYLAVFSPKLYRRLSADDRATYTWIFGSFAITVVCILVPTSISFFWPTEDVKYDCGRKAALGVSFGIFDYALNMILHTVSFMMNVRTYIQARGVQQSSANLKKLRIYTVISGLSTVLVAFPNACSLYTATVAFLPEAFMKYTLQMTCANCVLMFFVYLTVNPDYRHRCLSVITCGHVSMLPTFMVPSGISTMDAVSVMGQTARSVVSQSFRVGK